MSAAAAKQLLSRRAYAFSLQAVARHLLAGKYQRLVHCLHVPISKTLDDTFAVPIDYSRAKTRARFSGLQTCGSVWLCPVCSSKIAQGRREELQQILNHYRDRYFPYLLTATVSHHHYDRLADVYAAIRAAWTALRQSASFRNFKQRYGYCHDITALELPYSERNGWHPHFHSIALFDHELTEDEFAQVTDYFKSRWLRLTAKYGFAASCECGITLLPRSDEVAAYVAKFGYLPQGWQLEDEVTRSHVKTGRSTNSYSPFQLLNLHFFGEESWAGAKFKEYAHVMKGKRQLRYSKGFRAEIERDGFLLASDEHLAGEVESDYEWLYSLDVDEWRRLQRFGLRGLLLDYVEQVQGNVWAVRAWLKQHGVLLEEK